MFMFLYLFQIYVVFFLHAFLLIVQRTFLSPAGTQSYLSFWEIEAGELGIGGQPGRYSETRPCIKEKQRKRKKYLILVFGPVAQNSFLFVGFMKALHT
jgi:hypothetical protein